MPSSAPAISLVDVFQTNAREAAAIVERCAATPAAVREAAERALQNTRRRVIAGNEFVPEEIFAALRNLPGVINQPADEQLATADAGITEAFAGIASAGSICIASGPSLASAASLMMPFHLVLLPASRIVARPRDVFDSPSLASDSLHRDLVFITGPSATADMGPLVRGVHGPHRLHILLLEQA
jgi:L-lactate dehydrogenase complex protein LldG